MTGPSHFVFYFRSIKEASHALFHAYLAISLQPVGSDIDAITSASIASAPNGISRKSFIRRHFGYLDPFKRRTDDIWSGSISGVTIGILVENGCCKTKSSYEIIQEGVRRTNLSQLKP